MSETDLVKQIIEYLTICGVDVWRQNTGGRTTFRWGKKGSGDISGILPDGRRLEIECKSKGKAQSEDQKDFHAMIEKNGGVYILAYSIADVLPIVKKGV